MTRILIVDDKEDNLYYLRTLLSAHGFEIDSARHGAEALRKAHEAPPDMVVSDLLMPVMDGYTLLRHWKSDERLRQAPFIVYTATYTAPEDESLALDLGADAFLLKPSEPDDLLAQIRRIAARTSAAQPIAPQLPQRAEKELLEQYSAALIRKLEYRSLQLEASNRSLQADIVARERAEAARDDAQRQSSERAALLDALFVSVPDAVLTLDAAGRLRMINRPSSLFGLEATLGTDWLERVEAEYRPALGHAFRSVLESGQGTSLELSVPLAAARTTYWITLAPIVSATQITGAVVVARDISERKRTEAQLIVSDRMASVGGLAASVAHEINNPLMCVTANLALVEQSLGELGRDRAVPSPLVDALRDAREGAERVRLIVRDLRIFSRGEDEKRGPVDVTQVLDSTLRMAWNELRHRARLVKRYAQLPPVDSNEARLGQVFLNLIVNAAQAIPEGSYEQHELRVETRFDTATQRVLVSVSDTGTGIPPEIQARLFTPFVTTKPVGVGTGLGLSICHRIVTGLGGSIDFVSEVGRGTTFRVWLPRAADSVDIASAAPVFVVSAERRGRVLFVDDDDMVTQVVRRALAPEHDVSIVNSADAAIQLFRAGQRFDVVLCDLMMPQVTGMELYRTLWTLDRSQAAQMVFMTGGAFTGSAREFLASVPNEHLEKPFELAQLRQLINQLVR